MAKKFKVKTKDGLAGKLLKKIVTAIKKRPQFIYLQEPPLAKRSIIIGNHSGAKGAFTYRAFMDERFMTWGAHQMCEGYKSRWNYLYHTFYRKKLGYSKVKAFITATLFGVVSKAIYGFAGIIPVYYDMKVKNTFKYSFDCLEQDISVFVFPENSAEGYKDILEELYPGFLRLAQLYNNKYGTDLPINTLYFSRKHNKVVYGEPFYLSQLKEKYATEDEIADFFRQYMNSLYVDHILGKEND